MKAMIFAAGLGTRLKPLTDSIPKAMVPIAGKPMLQHVIEKLKAAGFNEIVINIHHLGEQIIDFITSNNSFDIRIEFSNEEEQLLDTGGGIKKAASFFNDGKPFLIHNVDIISNIDLKQLYDSHLKENNPATLVCSSRDTSRYLLFDNNRCLKGWINKKTGEVKSPSTNFNPNEYNQLAFSGIHVINPSVFDLMDPFPDKFSIIDFYLSICSHNNIVSYSPENIQIIDIGKHESLLLAEDILKTDS